MPTYSILTTTGKNKEAAALAAGEPLTIAEIAFGDGDYAPTGGETELVNEIDRRGVQASGTVGGAPNTAFFQILLEAEDGPYIIHEAGLIDDDGDLIAIVKYDPPINKPVPASGQTVEALLRLHVVFSDLENLVLRIETINAFVAAERAINTSDGIGGGGDLAEDRTHKLAVQTLGEITGAQVKDEEGNRDWLVVHDSSAGIHKKLSPNEAAIALGVQAKIDAAIGGLPPDQVLGLATVAEHLAGVNDTKAANPKGVKAAILAAIGPGGNVRAFEHANDSNQPTAGEWATPPDGAKALVSNASNNMHHVWERRAGAWVKLLAPASGSLGISHYIALTAPAYQTVTSAPVTLSGNAFLLAANGIQSWSVIGAVQQQISIFTPSDPGSGFPSNSTFFTCNPGDTIAVQKSSYTGAPQSGWVTIFEF
ncbi:MAG: hypothetical protein COA37_17905 [Hoeflea sp.]|uniref:phage tail-collar fiber domain-containing protein n=1 Tax=Hoeflea sp. TaxID=1940281 RepID=UPI000C0D5726|nr:phage tail protein [Hoeflea sp.]PHR19304.1 MAG: hypothetical protein COA37_17905 [Hoeflea sp.]